MLVILLVLFEAVHWIVYKYASTVWLERSGLLQFAYSMHSWHDWLWQDATHIPTALVIVGFWVISYKMTAAINVVRSQMQTTSYDVAVSLEAIISRLERCADGISDLEFRDRLHR